MPLLVKQAVRASRIENPFGRSGTVYLSVEIVQGAIVKAYASSSREIGAKFVLNGISRVPDTLKYYKRVVRFLLAQKHRLAYVLMLEKILLHLRCVLRGHLKSE